MTGLHWIDPEEDEHRFPDVEQALREPDGLLAVGGRLTPTRLQAAYRQGIFPWYSVGQPILWWSPDPRSVLFPERLKVSRSLRKTLRKGLYRVTYDTVFCEVIDACAAPRPEARGTWITPAMRRAYCRLYELGVAHSVESWHGGELVGGLYGVVLGRVFFGESMFSRMTDASKVALVHLVRRLQERSYGLVDCQVHSEHLASLGAETIPRRRFIALLERWCEVPGELGPWSVEATPAEEDTAP
jgi:leucyl/phenylalanyl-tRNA--protein transferase